MLIAAQKYEDNIAEYLLYMWHVEDVVRACKFDMQVIIPNLIVPQSTDPKLAVQIEQWYVDLIQKMRVEGIEEKGHLSELNDVLIELLYLHNSLLNISKDKEYEKIYFASEPFIKEFNAKSKSTSINPVETCLNGQYAKLMLRLKKTEITKETEEAFEHFRIMLAYLAKVYKQMKTGTYTAVSN